MTASTPAESPRPRHLTTAERTSDRELTVTRTFDAPARSVFRAWTEPALLARWWVPKSFGLTLLSCEMDVRVGGGYRLTFAPMGGATEPMAFFGTYREVVVNERLVWTNEEGADGAVTTVTFEELNGKTRVVMRDRYPSKEALDEAMTNGSTSGFEETFAQLEVLIAASP